MTPVVLASKSASRAAILAGAGVAFDTLGPGVDEGEAKTRLLAAGAGPKEIAAHLAEAKAKAVSAIRPEALVIGADQTLDLGGALRDKAESPAEARERLVELRGREHHLHSAVVVARGGSAIWRTLESPRLRMRAFSDAFLDRYLARNGQAVLGSVGCYMLEGEGAQLFERMEGDYFAILGLPLLPLLAFLRGEGALMA
ncbi:MAG: Maf family protein [Caulobacteraceae bacterium]